MRAVTVIADDLTGAADCGIAFALAGLATYVAVGGRRPPRADVVAVDTDSRQVPRAAAEERVGAAAREAYTSGSRTVYKKIDSTLRGNVGPEVSVVLEEARRHLGARPLAIVSPAFPATGRVTRRGGVLVGGVPLADTEVWRNSGMTGPSELTAVLAAVGLRATVVPEAVVRSGGDGLRVEIGQAARGGSDAVICDAASEADLEAIARAGAKLEVPVVWVGSAGLARPLPAALGAPGVRRDARPGDAALQRPGAALVLVGSRSGVAREQARRLRDDPGVEWIEVAPEALLGGEAAPRWAAARGRLREALAAGRDTVVIIGLGEHVDLGQGPALAAALGRLAGREAASVSGLVATGGDIARAVLAALGAGGLHLIAEVEPGVPMGLADGEPPLPVITKAGAFGTPDTLRRCRAALSRGSKRST